MEVAIAAIVVGTAVSAMGAIQQGNFAKKMGKANADRMKKEADYVLAKSEVDADRRERQTRLARGENIATFSKTGLRMEGSVIDLMADNAIENKLDEELILHAGKKQSDSMRYEAMLEEIKGRQKAKQGRISAAGTLITGLGSAGLAAYDTGAFGLGTETG